MQALIQSDARLQSAASPMTALFSNKEDGVPMDAQIYMGKTGIALVYRMNNVANTNQQVMAWLKRYNQFVSGTLKAPATPAAERCTVMVEATYEGQLKYYFSYMMRYEDDSLAQGMPQTRLYATEPLHMASQPALQAVPAQPVSQQAEEASWL
jgi:hypothetical protein